VTPQKPRRVVPTLREAEAARNTSDVDVEHQLPHQLAGGDGLPDGLRPHVPFPDVSLPYVPIADGPLIDVPVPEARPDGSVGEE
jgi:hypothetical protein